MIVGLAAAACVALAAWWWWLGRAPRDRGVYLSAEWRAAQRARE